MTTDQQKVFMEWLVEKYCKDKALTVVVLQTV